MKTTEVLFQQARENHNFRKYRDQKKTGKTISQVCVSQLPRQSNLGLLLLGSLSGGTLYQPITGGIKAWKTR